MNHSVSIPLSQFAVTGLPPPSPMRSRQGSEDWVVQTRGLKIVGDGNSPQPDQSTFTPILERPELREGGIESPHVDGDMVRIRFQRSYDSNEHYHAHIIYLGIGFGGRKDDG